MKHKGSISQTYRRRDEVIIPQLYLRAKRIASYPTTIKGLFRLAADIPVDRHYLADDTAVFYIRNRLFRGINKTFKNPYKQRLFDSLFNIVCEIRSDDRYCNLGLEHITMMALQRPAPCVGISPVVMYMIYQKINRNKQQKNEKV